MDLRFTSTLGKIKYCKSSNTLRHILWSAPYLFVCQVTNGDILLIVEYYLLQGETRCASVDLQLSGNVVTLHRNITKGHCMQNQWQNELQKDYINVCSVVPNHRCLICTQCFIYVFRVLIYRIYMYIVCHIAYMAIIYSNFVDIQYELYF